jgi:hypothetical protein
MASIPATRGRDAAAISLYAGIAAVFIASIVLRQAFPIFAIAHAGHDDLLFVKLADNLGYGRWLGGYDNLTLAKGAFYSFFLLANQVTGLPLKITEQIVYLAVVLYLSFAIGTLFRSRLAIFACFTLLAFNPLLWTPGVGGRVVRDGLYVSLSLLLLTICVHVFVLERVAAPQADLAAKRRLLEALGLVAGAYWLTREEGAWLAPALLLLAAYWFLRLPRREPAPLKARLRQALRLVAIPAVGFCIVVGTVNLINYAKYRTFRNNDFRSADFQGAYGALSRIQHAQPAPYVLFPKDAREKAYSVSGAARELRPFFEGTGGENWRAAGCNQSGRNPCPEILAGWFMWALRDAVAVAGHYRSAAASSGFYERLQQEIDDACDRGAIACGPRRSSLIPPWRPEYLAATIAATRVVFGKLISLDDVSASIGDSLGSAEQKALFERVTNGPLATAQDTYPGGNNPERIRIKIADKLARAQVHGYAVAIPLALLAWCVLVVVSVVRKRWHPGHIVIAALVAAAGVRVVLLGFLDATSIPFNMLYLAPVVPMAMVLPPCVIFLGIELFRRGGVRPDLP